MWVAESGDGCLVSGGEGVLVVIAVDVCIGFFAPSVYMTQRSDCFVGPLPDLSAFLAPIKGVSVAPSRPIGSCHLRLARWLMRFCILRLSAASCIPEASPPARFNFEIRWVAVDAMVFGLEG